MNPFLDIRVVPSYGKFQARVTWKTSLGFQAGVFTIYRSADGLNGWDKIGTVYDTNSFLDETLFPDSKFVESYYRVTMVDARKKSFESPIASTFGTVSRAEFGPARYITELEYKDLKQRTLIHLFKLKISAPYCTTCLDEELQINVGLTLCETCYGTALEGGYWRPALRTYMRVTNISEKTKTDSQEGTGTSDPVYFKARMLAFPSLEKDDLIVDPMTDRRFLVETSTVNFFNGKIPTVSEVSMVLLRRDSVKYKLPLT